MIPWTLTKGLTNLRNQVNNRWPNRDKTSDGTISDAAHKTHTSGHNSDDTKGSMPAWDGDPDNLPEVRAWDMDTDLRESGTNAQMLVDHLIRLDGLEKVIRYIIFNRKMYHSRDNFNPTDYTGTNPHTQHIHFEGAWTQSADENTTFNYRLNEVGDMSLTQTEVTEAVWGAEFGSEPNRETAGERLAHVDQLIDTVATKADLTALEERLLAAIQNRV